MHALLPQKYVLFGGIHGTRFAFWARNYGGPLLAIWLCLLQRVRVACAASKMVAPHARTAYNSSYDNVLQQQAASCAVLHRFRAVSLYLLA
jgi:hypothetical protein